MKLITEIKIYGIKIDVEVGELMKFFIIVGEFSEQVGEFKKIYLKVGELSGDELWQTRK